MAKVVLAGGTGFIGEYFNQQFKLLGYDVEVISRSTHISWDDEAGIIKALDGGEMLINLAGKSVNCRYNNKNKHEILNSRLTTTRILGDAMKSCTNPPPLWINSSTATIYRHAEDHAMTEANGEIGSGFSVDVATEWEKAFYDYETSLSNTRFVALRTAIVLGENGGVMTPYKNLTKFGLGGIQGKGNQMFSWIHVSDMFNIVRFIQNNKELTGVFNCSAPNPVTNRELMKLFRDKMNMPIGLPAPKWLLGLGAVFIGTETELVLKSRWVIPERLEQAGFKFAFPTLEETLEDILGIESK